MLKYKLITILIISVIAVVIAPNIRTSKAVPGGMVSLTFDDGWQSIYTYGIPILEEANLKSTQYIVSTKLYPWYGRMTLAQVLDMQAKGHEIGGHTRNHVPLAQVTSLYDQMTGGRQDLLAMGVTTQDAFAYPFGEYNAQARQAVIDAGYTSGRSVDLGFNTINTDKYLLKTQHVELNTTVAQVKAWIDQANAEGTWLILMFHQIDPNAQAIGAIYGTTPTVLQGIVDYLLQTQSNVVTVSQGLALLNGGTPTPSPTPTASPTPTPIPTNLILNPTVDVNTLNWKKGGWGTNTRSLTHANGALRTEITAYTSGDAKWYNDDVLVQPSQTYNFSDSYEANVSSEVVVRFTSTTGVVSYQFLGSLPAGTGTASFNFTTPANVASLSVFHLISKVGWLVTDNYLLN